MQIAMQVNVADEDCCSPLLSKKDSREDTMQSSAG